MKTFLILGKSHESDEVEVGNTYFEAPYIELGKWEAETQTEAIQKAIKSLNHDYSCCGKGTKVIDLGNGDSETVCKRCGNIDIAMFDGTEFKAYQLTPTL